MQRGHSAQLVDPDSPSIFRSILTTICAEKLLKKDKSNPKQQPSAEIWSKFRKYERPKRSRFIQLERHAPSSILTYFNAPRPILVPENFQVAFVSYICFYLSFRDFLGKNCLLTTLYA
jgi:hypothetical protein